MGSNLGFRPITLGNGLEVQKDGLGGHVGVEE